MRSLQRVTEIQVLRHLRRDRRDPHSTERILCLQITILATSTSFNLQEVIPPHFRATREEL